MLSYEDHILRILGEATDPLFPSEITERLNRELGAEAAYSTSEVSARLWKLAERLEQLADGRWTLKSRVS